LFSFWYYFKLLIKCADVKFLNPSSDFLPCDLVDLSFSFILQEMEEAVVVADRVDGVGQRVDVPVVNLDTVGKDLRASALP
jgi:hypothetical protein